MVSRASQPMRWTSLVLATLGIAVIWTTVLPRLESHPVVRSRIDHLQRHGIDPAAMFYTDLERMSAWEADVAAARARTPEAFWITTQPSGRDFNNRPVSFDEDVHAGHQEQR